ncbi:MAG: hypothetical protein WKF92_03585 [Pyrinomonadaceae bacterium]
MENFEPIINLDTAECLTFEAPEWLEVDAFEHEAIEKNCPIYDTREPGIDREELWPLGWDRVGDEPAEIVESNEGAQTEREEEDEFWYSIDQQYKRYLRIRAEEKFSFTAGR